MPRISLVVILGYLVLGAMMTVTVMELWWQPSLFMIAMVLTWGLVGNTLIFLHFIESFVYVKEPGQESNKSVLTQT